MDPAVPAGPMRIDARRPQALAASHGAPPREGLDWLGRPPSPRTGLAYRILTGLADVLLFGLCRVRLRVSGRGRLPADGYLLAVALHRSWADPLVILRACPREPQPWFLASGPSLLTGPWRERLFRHIGGVLPVWRGGTNVDRHVASARAAVEAGCPLVVLIEGGVSGPPDRPGRVRGGIGVLALRAGVPIVPLAIAGSDQLYRGKRVRARFLSPTTVADLLGPAWDGRVPPAGTRDELRLAHRVTVALAGRLEREVAAMYPATVDSPGMPRRWRWLERLFL
jgi:1-acyl-sn-glycerol-3-phosphate acyltransferase